MKKKIEMPEFIVTHESNRLGHQVYMTDEFMNWMQQVTEALNGEDEWGHEKRTGSFVVGKEPPKQEDEYEVLPCSKCGEEITDGNRKPDGAFKLQHRVCPDKQEDECHHRIIGEPSTMYGGKCRVCGYQVGDKEVSLEVVKELVRDNMQTRFDDAIDDIIKKLEEL